MFSLKGLRCHHDDLSNEEKELIVQRDRWKGATFLSISPEPDGKVRMYNQGKKEHPSTFPTGMSGFLSPNIELEV